VRITNNNNNNYYYYRRGRRRQVHLKHGGGARDFDGGGVQ